MAENSTELITISPEIITLLNVNQTCVIRKVYIAFLTPSVIGSFSVLLVSLLRWRNLQEQRQLLVQLALADLLASVLLLVVTNIQRSDLCPYLLPLALMFYILSFILVIIYAHESKNVLQGWRTRPADCEDIKRGGPWEKVRYVLLWLVLGGLYGVYTQFVVKRNAVCSVKGVTACCRSCLLFSDVRNDNVWREEPIYFFLFFMYTAVILFRTVNYHSVSQWYQCQQQHQQALFPVEGDGQSRRRFKHVKYITMRMVMVIFFCWTPALLLFVLTSTMSDQASLYPLYIIQAMTVSLQGFLNSVVYAWNRPNFTEAVLGERTPLISYRHTTFFEESIRSTV